METGPHEPAPTLEEVEKALKYTRDGKAAGPDDIPIELLKLGGDSVVKAMHKIVVCVWNTGKWPEDWTQSTFVPLYKKGDPTVCANYRTISLISHASKVLLKVILARIHSSQRPNSKWQRNKLGSGRREARTTTYAVSGSSLSKLELDGSRSTYALWTLRKPSTG